MLHSANNNMTINDKKEDVIDNRDPNGSSDLYRVYIDKDTVKLRDNISVEYYSHPHINLNKSITYSNNVNISKTVENDNSISNYKTDTIFIDTLDSNPLVNDIFHQKNY